MRLWTWKCIAARLEVHERYARALVKQGLPVRRRLGRVYVLVAELDAWERSVTRELSRIEPRSARCADCERRRR